MALIAYNKTGDPVALAAGNPPPTLPASPSPPDRGGGVYTTLALKDLSATDYDAIQAQISAGTIELEWLVRREYSLAGSDGELCTADTLAVDTQGQTTDEQPLDLFKGLVADGSACLYRALVIARDTGSGGSNAYLVVARVSRVGSSAPTLGDASPSHLFTDEAHLPWNATWVVGANNVILRVTGEAGHTIRWSSRVEQLRVS